MQSVPLMQGLPPTALRQAAVYLHQTYPGDSWLSCLQPDLLGEHLIARELAHDNLLLGAALDGRSVRQRMHAMTTLCRMAARDDRNSCFLDAALANRSHLAYEFSGHCGFGGGPITDILLRRFAACEDRDTLERIFDRLNHIFPGSSLASKLAIACGTRLYELFRKNRKSVTPDNVANMASLLTNLSVRYRLAKEAKSALRCARIALFLKRSPSGTPEHIRTMSLLRFSILPQVSVTMGIQDAAFNSCRLWRKAFQLTVPTTMEKLESYNTLKL